MMDLNIGKLLVLSHEDDESVRAILLRFRGHGPLLRYAATFAGFGAGYARDGPLDEFWGG